MMMFLYSSSVNYFIDQTRFCYARRLANYSGARRALKSWKTLEFKTVMQCRKQFVIGLSEIELQSRHGRLCHDDVEDDAVFI